MGVEVGRWGLGGGGVGCVRYSVDSGALLKRCISFVDERNTVNNDQKYRTPTQPPTPPPTPPPPNPPLEKKQVYVRGEGGGVG